MLLTPDLHVADALSKQLALALGPDILSPAYSWLSLTERSEYTTSEAEYAATLEKDEKLTPGTPEFQEKITAFNARMTKYLKDRLEPNLPDWPVICFYPMSKRRGAPGQNWYALDHAARKALMAGHARVGRTYSGRILQLITGSTGLDDMEWAVTLFAKTTSEVKAIVYEMRFDEVSAQYAGIRRLLHRPPNAAGHPLRPADLVTMTLADKTAALQDILRAHAPLLVAYSGGVDSACLLAFAHKTLGAQALGVIADSPSLRALP